MSNTIFTNGQVGHHMGDWWDIAITHVMLPLFAGY